MSFIGKKISVTLKRKAENIFEMYPDDFVDNFEKNKKFLKKLRIFEYSKADRNVVAGYITRLKKKKRKEED